MNGDAFWKDRLRDASRGRDEKQMKRRHGKPQKQELPNWAYDPRLYDKCCGDPPAVKATNRPDNMLSWEAWCDRCGSFVGADAPEILMTRWNLLKRFNIDGPSRDGLHRKAD